MNLTRTALCISSPRIWVGLQSSGRGASNFSSVSMTVRIQKKNAQIQSIMHCICVFLDASVRMCVFICESAQVLSSDVLLPSSSGISSPRCSLWVCYLPPSLAIWINSLDCICMFGYIKISLWCENCEVRMRACARHVHSNAAESSEILG